MSFEKFCGLTMPFSFHNHSLLVFFLKQIQSPTSIPYSLSLSIWFKTLQCLPITQRAKFKLLTMACTPAWSAHPSSFVPCGLPLILHPSHTGSGLLVLSIYLKTFARSVPSAWNAFPSDTPRTAPSGLCSPAAFSVPLSPASWLS